MAKNLLEQFLDFATSKLTGPIGDDIYIKEETEVKTGLTGVARYLAKQEQAEQAAAALTGVAKYLAKQQAQAADKPAATEAAAAPAAQAPAAPVSRVAKYLASQAAAQPAAAQAAAEPAAQAPASAPLSRVEKYLASQAAASKPAATEAATAPAAQAPAAPVSRVAKYLASQQGASAAPAAAETAAEPAAATQEAGEQESSAPLSRVAKYLAAVGKEFIPEVAQKSETAPQPQAEPAKRTGVSKYLSGQDKALAESAGFASTAQVVKDLGHIEVPSEEIEAATEEETVSDSGDVIRLDDGIQCQASTAKGTQCKNKSNLGHIQLTVDDQKYRFSVCTQHNNENFKPFAELLES